MCARRASYQKNPPTYYKKNTLFYSVRAPLYPPGAALPLSLHQKNNAPFSKTFRARPPTITTGGPARNFVQRAACRAHLLCSVFWRACVRVRPFLNMALECLFWTPLPTTQQLSLRARRERRAPMRGHLFGPPSAPSPFRPKQRRRLFVLSFLSLFPPSARPT